MVKKTIIVVAVVFAIFVVAIALLSTSYPKSVYYGDQIAIIKLEGAITTQQALIPAKEASPSSFISLLDEAENDPSIKAIVIEINSPGGSPVASDEMASRVRASNKTTVAWISEVGASAAYLVASSADKVVSHPLSITCSIGTYMIVGDWTGFFEELGMNYTVIKSGKYKDVGSMYKELEPDEQELLQDIVNKMNDEFVARVARNRNLSKENLGRVANGKPCIGMDALKYGLVDELGSEQDAIDLAAELAGLKKPKTVTLAEDEDFFSSLFSAKLTRAFYTLGVGIGHGMQDQGATFEIKS